MQLNKFIIQPEKHYNSFLFIYSEHIKVAADEKIPIRISLEHFFALWKFLLHVLFSNKTLLFLLN